MDKRNEYRVRPSPESDVAYAEFREPRRFFGFGSWQKISCFYGKGSLELAERACRIHAGEGTKYLGRLP